MEKVVTPNDYLNFIGYRKELHYYPLESQVHTGLEVEIKEGDDWQEIVVTKENIQELLKKEMRIKSLTWKDFVNLDLEIVGFRAAPQEITFCRDSHSAIYIIYSFQDRVMTILQQTEYVDYNITLFKSLVENKFQLESVIRAYLK